MKAAVAVLSASCALACVPGPVETGAASGQGCYASPDCPQGFFCVEGACQLMAGTCQSQSDCHLPDVCMSGHCLPGCAVTGCDTGQACAQGSGLCVPTGSADAGGETSDGGGTGMPDAGGNDGPPDAGAGAPDAGGGPPTSITNGTFETGDFAGWTTGGQTSISTDAHSGSASAMVGNAAPSVDSMIAQEIALPSAAQLSFWFKSVCADTVEYDWATVTVKSTSGSILAVALPRTCTGAGTWVQQTADLSTLAGQTVVLSFENHDDDYPGDPTYTLFDDIAISGGIGAY